MDFLQIVLDVLFVVGVSGVTVYAAARANGDI